MVVFFCSHVKLLLLESFLRFFDEFTEIPIDLLPLSIMETIKTLLHARVELFVDVLRRFLQLLLLKLQSLVLLLIERPELLLDDSVAEVGVLLRVLVYARMVLV